MSHGTDRTATRRAVLAASGGGLAALAGCLGFPGDEGVPEPTTLSTGLACDNCSMVIDRQPGPVGQSYYLEEVPAELEDREDGRARFCSTWCLYSFTLDRAQQGIEPAGSYATDYSAVEYTLTDDAGTTIIDPTPHLDAESFARVSELVFVVDSDVEGSMGASLIGFSEREDAEAFAGEHGGDLFEDDDITLELIAAMGTS